MPDAARNIKYETQQKNIYNNLLAILNFNGDYSFLLIQLDNDHELQTKILGLLPDIRKYFAISSHKWARLNCSRPYLGIIRYLLRQFNKTLYSVEISILMDSTYKRTRKYMIM
jgi:hypothetical protein